MISVRQASDLPPASFRFPVTQDTLALGYILPAVGRIGDFHPLKHAPAGRTKKTDPGTGSVWEYVIYAQTFCHISYHPKDLNLYNYRDIVHNVPPVL